MLTSIIQQIFDNSLKKQPALSHLIFLAVSIMILNSITFTIGSSLFLSNAGAQNLPITYILIGLLLIPLFTVFSQIVDRFNRLQLFQYIILIVILLSLIFRYLLIGENLVLYYLLFLSIYFLWLFSINIFFPSLVSDYFTTLDWKRYGPFLSLATAIGGLLGGGLVTSFSTYLKTEDILFIIPGICVIMFLQVVYLQNSEKPLEKQSSENQNDQLESIKNLPKLAKQYPIIIFLALNTVIYIILFSVTDFLNFSIYSQAFPDDRQLTGFLGLMRVINNILQLFIIYFFTRPLIQRVGVSKMTLVYGFTTIGSFILRAFSLDLPTAIIAHINNDGLDKSINSPIQTLNFNAVPHHLVGQLRMLCDGLFSSIGLTFTGIILFISQVFFTPFQIVEGGIVLSIGLLGIRYIISNSYLPSIITLLRSHLVSLEDVGEVLVDLSSQYNPEITQLLKEHNYDEQILGLELASRLEHPGDVLEEINNKSYLESDYGLLADVALIAIAKARNERAENIIFEYLQSDYRLVKFTQQWRKQIPEDRIYGKEIKLILDDYHQQLIHRVLSLVVMLDEKQQLSFIRPLLNSHDIRLKANAIEALLCLPYKRFILPILPLLEVTSKNSLEISQISNYQLAIKDLPPTNNLWIKIAAFLADPHLLLVPMEPMPQQYYHPKFPKIPHLESLRKRDNNIENYDSLRQLFFLKSTSLLGNLYLDELSIVNSLLDCLKYQAGEAIAWSENPETLYLVYQGSLVLLYDSEEIREFKPGESFKQPDCLEDRLLSNTAILAKTDCQVLRLSKNKFQEVIDMLSFMELQ
ncbi:hypothetical protein BCD67_01520 [Oscillatoriales cyanobacterium USR001]|nr:hypothetical protein BCD67_01520 [Oscillatoriales cyanobacterium USR001]